ncbi:phage portal protein [Sphingobium yanoikuyae]|uniref:phage portal protein n=1 Tax=Sphingobium yanoikuyae TaxID=13690 RepID=UPI001377B237|nr:phage portal protein [Sphingobium yanoikuyae]NBB38667.1 phage portal protein [Sphingobium yanoikuyae]
MLFNIFGAERRSHSLENPSVSLTDASAWSAFFNTASSLAGETITFERALSIPAVWAAVNVIAGTIAHLPFHLFKTQGAVTEKDSANPLYRVIHDRPNDIHTSYAFRKMLVSRLLLDGRFLSIIVADGAGRTTGLIPVPVSKVTIKQQISGRGLSRSYTIDGVTYSHTQILDFNLLVADDGVSTISPLVIHRDTFGLMLAAERYASTLLVNGGVPPMALETPAASSPEANTRASEQISTIIAANKRHANKVLPLPTGFSLTPIGVNARDQQLLELRQFQIGEVARILNIAPAMLHDLSTGTYSNVEQQNLNFAQHTIVPLVELIEQEMNAKLFGKKNSNSFVEFDLDGLQRGDFASRMTGLAMAVNTALITPNEARALDNRPPLEGGDELMIQGATVRLKAQPDTAASEAAQTQPEPQQPATQDETNPVEDNENAE